MHRGPVWSRNRTQILLWGRRPIHSAILWGLNLKVQSALRSLMIWCFTKVRADQGGGHWWQLLIWRVCAASACPPHLKLPQTVLPAEPLGDKTHAERGEHAPDGEDGHGQRPEGREGPRGDGLPVPVQPCSVVVLLNDLEEKKRVILHLRWPKYHLSPTASRLLHHTDVADNLVNVFMWWETFIATVRCSNTPQWFSWSRSEHDFMSNRIKPLHSFAQLYVDYGAPLGVKLLNHTDNPDLCLINEI